MKVPGGSLMVEGSTKRASAAPSSLCTIMLIYLHEDNWVGLMLFVDGQH